MQTRRLGSTAAAALAWLVACDGGGGAAGDGGPGRPADGGARASDASAGDAGGAAADARPVARCDAPRGEPGDDVWTIDTADGPRTARVHVPPGYDPRARTPVVLNFHGYTSTAQQQEWFSGLPAKADAAGFIAVHPQGVGNSWNGGVGCCGDALAMDIDDVGFVRALIDELEARLCVDPHRIYATGMSNGGYLSHRLGCDLSDRIAAIAPVAGLQTSPGCAPSRPVSVIHFHGTADTLVPYDQVAATIAGWVDRNGCAGTSTVTYANGDSTCETWSGCDQGVEVVLCTVDGGGHTWPGGAQVPGLGKTTTDLNANDAMWALFERHALP
ncbi:MAG: hypothetical protein D6689_15130 [Deltaproteobacteria bacterium]|nr:MAG: hypothetical protein D6689_15130 [Deltaproteobacteria bacterium]